MRRTIAAPVWLLWVGVAAAVTMVTRNPFYLLILLLVARIVLASCSLPLDRIQLPFWRLAFLVLLFSFVFNLLLVRFGQTVLLSLPESWWLVGGNLTLEAGVYGAISGLILITLLALFVTFNAVVPTSELVRLTPRAMSNVGMVVLIALTYVPETRRHLERIREAQAIRGHRLRGWREWQPIAIPLLIGGMERAMNLAETMVARGYGATQSKPQSPWMLLGLLGGLLLALSGWVLAFWFGPWGWFLLLGGTVIILVLLYLGGQQVATTRYRTRTWQAYDWSLAALYMLVFILVVVVPPMVGNSPLYYTPYPSLTLPPFDAIIGLALALLAAPALVVEW